MAVLIAIETVVIVLLGVLVAGLLRSHAEIVRNLHQLGVRSDGDHGRPVTASLERVGASGAVSDIAGVSPALEPMSITLAGSGRLTLLSFLTSGCLTCRSFWDAFGDPSLHVPGEARLVIVAKGPEADSPSAIADLAPMSIPTVLSSEAWSSFGVPGSPYFVLVDGERQRVIGEGTSSSWPDVTRLLTNALADAGLNQPAPDAVVARPSPTAGSESTADTQLRAAGIGPGHPSLYPTEHGDASG